MILDLVKGIFGFGLSFKGADVKIGYVTANGNSILANGLSGIRLIRLIRIIKLYNYLIQSNKSEDEAKLKE